MMGCGSGCGCSKGLGGFGSSTPPAPVAVPAPAIFDAFGPQYRPMVEAGLVVLGAAVLFKIVRR